jgi:hypothetical protein
MMCVNLDWIMAKVVLMVSGWCLTTSSIQLSWLVFWRHLGTRFLDKSRSLSKSDKSMKHTGPRSLVKHPIKYRYKRRTWMNEPGFETE